MKIICDTRPLAKDASLQWMPHPSMPHPSNVENGDAIWLFQPVAGGRTSSLLCG